MAGGQITLRPPTGVAILVVTALLCHGAPAAASFNSVSACSDITGAKLELSATDLKKVVSPTGIDAVGDDEAGDAVDRVAPTRFSPPGTDVAALPDEAERGASPLASEGKRPPMNARVPGVSDEALSRFKRQMYRKDI